MKKVKISVNELIEFSARKGDYFMSSEGPSALQGQMAHKHVQAQRDETWEKEVTLSAHFLVGDYDVEVRGRADLLNSKNHLIVEEIKSSYSTLEHIEKNQLDFYFSQARVYAALFLFEQGNTLTTEQAENDNLIELRVCIVTLADLSTASESSFESNTKIIANVNRYVSAYCQWLGTLDAHHQIRNASADLLAYPFASYRDGQYELAKSAYNSFKLNQPLLVEAPTGLGKTMATVFPAVKTFAAEGTKHDGAKHILYLTCKTAGQIQPAAALTTLRSNGLKIKSLTLCAKDKICLCKDLDTSQTTCPYQVDYFDKLPEARRDAFAAELLDFEQLTRIAKRHQICPFSLSLEMSKWSDFIIADVNYYFDPLIKLAHFFENRKQTILLIDELHNLPARAAEMYSAELNLGELRELDVLLRTIALNTSNTKNFKQLLQGKIKLKQFANVLSESIAAVMTSGAATQSADQQQTLFTAGAQPSVLIKSCIRFIAIHQLMSNTHCILFNQNGEQSAVRIHCFAAQQFLKELTPKKGKIVGFSGTLRPIEHYRQSLGWSEKTAQLILRSPFPKGNLKVLHCAYIDTRLRQRVSGIRQLCKLVQAVIEAQQGNYLVFFPSFEYLNLFHQSWIDHADSPSRLIAQTAQIDDEAKREFLTAFNQSSQPTLGLAVLGGSFAEGVDLIGEQLIGSIIVGVGIAPPSEQQQRMEQWLQNNGLNPFLFGQLYPSFCKVLQAAGRVIRSENDRGIIVLADQRYSADYYQELFPDHWQVSHCQKLLEVETELSKFWQKSGS